MATANEQTILELGEEAELFEKSNLFKYLINTSRDDISQLHKALEDADPEDPKALRDLQNKIVVRRLFILWINEAIISAHQVAENLQIEESND